MNIICGIERLFEFVSFTGSKTHLLSHNGDRNEIYANVSGKHTTKETHLPCDQLFTLSPNLALLFTSDVVFRSYKQFLEFGPFDEKFLSVRGRPKGPEIEFSFKA